jgi:hypothetical protein
VRIHRRSRESSGVVVTAVDLLHLANTFSALAIHRRTEATKFSTFAASFTRKRWQCERRNG